MPYIIDGKTIAKEILQKVESKVLELKTNLNIQPNIATVLVGNNTASEIYVRAKLEAAERVGIGAQLIRLRHEISNQELSTVIKGLNQDKEVTGILVQLPLPTGLNPNIVFELIDYKKDIDGFGIYNTGLLNHWNTNILPCTPQGILHVLKKYLGNDLSGKKAVIIGRSVIVGRPMASILIKESCTVTLTHSKTVNLKQECQTADILIAAVGVPLLVKTDWIKEGCFVVDVGINRYDDKLTGDVDFENVKTKSSHITPVPGGIGPLTVANLMLNALKLCYLQNNLDLSWIANEVL
ncbi:bifunctional 5,10-methylenetetrahydrofolate dehydrogenase/5,10-methenyltetrahydrofolate cyclohydrolase [Candidatus Bandiella euplotis]|uniref:Bifunctional protein FolD n=1 Tax=Candidatus Bandiella euplotis TaxID=1664265 RepID=A0ABZ0UL50_9RICK|nr:bifunctional 5,10-methylenetetrahydrofolate dehydrogenase/5,10-methenyltetrahydrofolate cyclohydrolase [Candidatus Bandiella woodruffii]WPX96672.1 Bifunctional protein FolD protein [Candidatus Bandiella woodruffii]